MLYGSVCGQGGQPTKVTLHESCTRFAYGSMAIDAHVLLMVQWQLILVLNEITFTCHEIDVKFESCPKNVQGG